MARYQQPTFVLESPRFLNVDGPRQRTQPVCVSSLMYLIRTPSQNNTRHDLQ